MYQDIWYTSHDGLTLYARDYAINEQQRAAKHAVICIHGLTRNADDFSEVCERYSKEYRMIAVDVRGRARSEYDPNPDNYHPLTYAKDMRTLFAVLGLQSVALVGTSMGGIISMILASDLTLKVEAMVLNDIGPEIDPAGLQRIADFVAQSDKNMTWNEAVAHTKAFNASQYPLYTDNDWETATKQKYQETTDGSLTLNYDTNISKLVLESVKANTPASTLWPVFPKLSHIPTLVIRGQHSDILSRACVKKMETLHDNLQSIEVPDVGHPPLLNEPSALKALDVFLSGVKR